MVLYIQQVSLWELCILQVNVESWVEVLVFAHNLIYKVVLWHNKLQAYSLSLGITNTGENPITHFKHEYNIVQIHNIVTWDL
jgi:hypothetical protein